MSPKQKTSAGKGFTSEERAAMRERARELKAEARRGADRADGTREVLAKIAAMPEPDRGIATRLHDIITGSAPDLVPRLWYGMPAWSADDKVVCFFQSARKFNTRYSTLGFSDKAHLDDGTLWPVAFAVTKLTAAVEALDQTVVSGFVTIFFAEEEEAVAAGIVDERGVVHDGTGEFFAGKL